MENFSLELCQDRHGPLNRRANIFFFPLFSHGLLLFNVQSFISFVSLCYLPFVVVFFSQQFFLSLRNKQTKWQPPFFRSFANTNEKKNREENDDKFSLWTLSARSVDTTGGLSLQSTRTFSNTHKKERNIMIIKNNDNNKKKREPNERKKKKCFTRKKGFLSRNVSTVPIASNLFN